MQFNQIIYIGAGLHLKPIKDFPNTSKFIFVDVLPRSEWDGIMPPSYEWYRPQFYDNLVKKFNKYGFTLISTTCLDKNCQYEYNNLMNFTQRLQYWMGIPSKYKYINPTMLTFINLITRQSVNYYISTNIEHTNNLLLATDIIKSDALIYSGYIPNKKIFEYFIGVPLSHSGGGVGVPLSHSEGEVGVPLSLFLKPKIFIGYSNSSFNDPGKNNDATESEKNTIFGVDDINVYFNQFYIVDAFNLGETSTNIIKVKNLAECENLCHFLQKNSLKFNFH